MKNLKRMTSLFLSLVMILSLNSIIFATENDEINLVSDEINLVSDEINLVNDEINSVNEWTGWDYPVKAGTDEWAEFTTKDEMLASVQIPEDILSIMSTDELVDVVLRYPFLPDALCYNDYNVGMEYVIEEFNGIAELLNREDSVQYLIENYEELVVDKADKEVTSKSFSNETEVYDEYILAKEKIALLLIQPEIVNLIEVQKSKAEFTTDMLKSDISDKTTIGDNQYADMISALSAYTTSNAIVGRASLTVSTPKGNAVVVIARGELLTSADKTAHTKWIQTNYPLATVLGSATTNYNCHSYAWYSTSSTNKYWMNDPSKYMTDGSYNSTAYYSVGNKMYWASGHSAIIDGSGSSWYNAKVTSKWGEMSLVQHLSNYSPYSETPTCWTRS